MCFETPNSCKYITIIVMHYLCFLHLPSCHPLFWSCNQVVCFHIILWFTCDYFEIFIYFDLSCFVWSFVFHFCLWCDVWQFMLSTYDLSQSSIPTNAGTLSGTTKNCIGNSNCSVGTSISPTLWCVSWTSLCFSLTSISWHSLAYTSALPLKMIWSDKFSAAVAIGWTSSWFILGATVLIFVLGCSSAFFWVFVMWFVWWSSLQGQILWILLVSFLASGNAFWTLCSFTFLAQYNTCLLLILLVSLIEINFLIITIFIFGYLYHLWIVLWAFCLSLFVITLIGFES